MEGLGDYWNWKNDCNNNTTHSSNTSRQQQHTAAAATAAATIRSNTIVHIICSKALFPYQPAAATYNSSSISRQQHCVIGLGGIPSEIVLCFHWKGEGAPSNNNMLLCCWDFQWITIVLPLGGGDHKIERWPLLLKKKPRDKNFYKLHTIAKMGWGIPV